MIDSSTLTLTYMDILLADSSWQTEDRQLMCKREWWHQSVWFWS